MHEAANIGKLTPMIDTLRGSAAFAFIAVNTFLCCIPIYALALVRLIVPGALVPGVRAALNGAMTRFIDVWVSGNRWLVKQLGIARVHVTWSGDPLRRDRWYIVVCNHQSWADIMVLQTTLRPAIPPLKFFTKKELVWVPGVGLAMVFLGFPYVRRASKEELAANPALREVDKRAIAQACEGFLERPTAVLNFLEGTRFTPAKHEAQDSPYRHLLRPKAGGFAAVREALDDRLAAVVDVTIVYDGEPPGFWDLLCGRGGDIRFHARTLPVPPKDRASIEAWLANTWAEKDAMITTELGHV